MRIVVILNIDEDKVLEAHGNTDSTLGTAISGELGWAEQSGIVVVEVIEPDHEIYTYLDDADDKLNHALSSQIIGAHIVNKLIE